MDTISQKKVIISYFITSMVIFSISATTSMLGLLGNGPSFISGTLSSEFMVIIQFAIILIANGILHSLFYYGGLKSSPLVKGIGIGVFLGMSYFLFSIFVLDSYDINSDPFSMLLSAMSGRVIEYSSGGFVTALISVSDIHRWGLLRAF